MISIQYIGIFYDRWFKCYMIWFREFRNRIFFSESVFEFLSQTIVSHLLNQLKNFNQLKNQLK